MCTNSRQPSHCSRWFCSVSSSSPHTLRMRERLKCQPPSQVGHLLQHLQRVGVKNFKLDSQREASRPADSLDSSGSRDGANASRQALRSRFDCELLLLLLRALHRHLTCFASHFKGSIEHPTNASHAHSKACKASSGSTMHSNLH
jgi:hypothetical protein